MEDNKRAFISVVYEDEKEQTWEVSNGTFDEKDSDITYTFTVKNTTKVNIGIIYESGNMQAQIYAHAGESFIFLTKDPEKKLEVIYYKKGVQKTDMVGVGYKKEAVIDGCGGETKDLLYLEGRILNSDYFKEFFGNFKGILATKGLDVKKFQDTLNKVTAV